VYGCSAGCVILALIQLGSTLAFNIIVSLSVLGLMSTYMLSIGCVFLKRLKGEPLPYARWSLGRFGFAINGFALFYSAFLLGKHTLRVYTLVSRPSADVFPVWCCFPSYLPVTTSTANWAPVVWAAVIIVAYVVYAIWGKHHYTAPVEFVEGRKAPGVGLQSST